MTYKVFISQPMRGRSDEEILAERKEILAKAKAILNQNKNYHPAEVEEVKSFLDMSDKDPLWCLGESLKLLSTADIAFFAKGWDSARGCKLEHAAAEAYGIDCIEEE